MKQVFARVVACCGSFFFALTVMATAPAGAATLTPEDIVRQLYADYVTASPHPSQNPFEKIAVYASHSFAKAANKEAQCEMAIGTCVFDFDALRQGQCGGQVLDLSLKRSVDQKGLIVRADFNLDCGYENTQPFPTVVLFRFIQEGGAWKIDDVGLGYKRQIQSYDYARQNPQRHQH